MFPNSGSSNLGFKSIAMVKRGPDSGLLPFNFDTDRWPGGPLGGPWPDRWLVAGSVARRPIGGPWPARWPVVRSVAGGWIDGPFPITLSPLPFAPCPIFI